MAIDCGGCSRAGADRISRCFLAFKKIGLTKMHWECWSSCNLHCKFCYRTIATPLGYGEALHLLDVCRFAGIDTIVFAGGDPILRSDLVDLIDYAVGIGMSVELQSNFQQFNSAIKDRIRCGSVALTGLSLDGPTAEIHDTFRSTRGNFKAIIRALEFHEEYARPVIVRSIVSKSNADGLARIGELISQYSTIVRWSLLEFTPMGEGYANRLAYEMADSEFESAITGAIDAYVGAGEVDVYRNSDKVGTYGLVTPDGNLYGVTSPTLDGRYRIVGSMLDAHTSTLSDALPFDRRHHESRYGAGGRYAH